MTVTEQIVTIFIVALVTQLTRWIPFWVFRSSVHTPQYVNYLGRVLPSAIFGMLVVSWFFPGDETETFAGTIRQPK